MARPDDDTKSRMAQALALLGEACSYAEIGVRLGLSPPATLRLLKKLRAKMLPQIAAESNSIKYDLDLQLQWIAMQCVDSFRRSKTPRKRAAVKRPGDSSGPGDEVQTTEIVERDGETAYLNTMMAAMRERMRLWGLGVLESPNEAMSSISALAADMWARGQAYEQERRMEDVPGIDGNGPPS
jgi:hypothetical protein